MNTITHALLPVIAASLIERVDRVSDRNGIFSTREIIVIGIFGALPDLLNPHLSLAARYTSWSHGFPFWIGLTITLLLVSLTLRPRLPAGMAIWFSASYLLHLVCDAFSGGLAFMYPLSPYIFLKNQYFVPPQWWAWIDASCILIAYGLWRVAPHYVRKRVQGSHDTKM